MEAQARRGARAMDPRHRLIRALVLLGVAGTLAACSAAAGGTRSSTSTLADAGGHAKRHGAAGSASADPTSSTVASVPSTTAPALAPAPSAFGIGLTTAVWTEPEGSTENFYEGTSESGRVMQVQILYPTVTAKAPTVVPWAQPAYRYGPYPVIVFAHGFDVDPNTYRALLASWVEAGYVVVAPFFPDTSTAAIEAQQGVDTESDEFNQPGDVAFVVSQIVGAGHGSPPPYAAYLVRLVNSSDIILAGQSDGADTVAALLYDHEYAKTLASMGAQPKAVALLSGAEWTREEDVYSAPPGGGAPALVVQSLTDGCNDPADSSQLYNVLTASKWFLALSDATHLGPYVGDGEASAVVERVTVAFFDLELHRPKVTPASLDRNADVPGVSEIMSSSSVPLYPAPAWVPDACAAPPGAPTD